MLMLGDRTLEPLHIAAALGLPGLCQSLICSGADFNETSPLGASTYCALVGPAAFLRPIPGHSEDALGLAKANCPSIAQQETIQVIIDAGAVGLNITRPRFSAGPSVQSLALLVCLRLGSHKLFRRMYPPPKDDLDFEDDDAFRMFLTGGISKDGLDFMSATAINEFLTHVLPTIFDGFIDAFDSILLSDFLKDVWQMMGRIHPPLVEIGKLRPLLNMPDFKYSAMVRRAVRLSHEETVIRLTQDPRWNPNISYATWAENDEYEDYYGDEVDQTSLLHSAVADDSLLLVSLLVRTGANVHVQDATGRTPVLLAESVPVLELLINHGASTADKDGDGRNIWHFAAANNDCAILDWLILHDPLMEQNMQSRMINGRTPTAQAIIYPLLQIRCSPRARRNVTGDFLAGAYRLLNHCTSRKEFTQCHHEGVQPEERVLVSHAAVEWGSDVLLAMLRSSGADLREVDDNGNSPLHCLNFSANLEVLRILGDELPIYNLEGLTPLETIFLNTYIQGCPRGEWGGHSTAHPAFDQALDRHVYIELISMVAHSGGFSGGSTYDEALSQCWERFISHVIVGFASVDDNASAGSITYKSVVTAAKCLAEAGCLDSYERVRQESAILALADALIAKPCVTPGSPWHRLVFSLMFHVSMLIGDKASQDEHIRKDEAAVDRLLRWIVTNVNDDDYPHWCLRQLLVEVFPIPETIGGTPTFRYICESDCSVVVFELLITQAPLLTDPADVAMAFENITKTSHAETKLNYLVSVLQAHAGEA